MNINDLKELIDAVSKSDITEFEYKEGQMSLTLNKKAETVVTPAVPVEMAASQMALTPASLAPVPEAKPAFSGNVVKSPLVGTAYVSAQEGGEPLVKVGDTVHVGQPLIIIEAMKLMNEINSEFDGVVKEILVENGQIVEFEQPLFVIG